LRKRKLENESIDVQDYLSEYVKSREVDLVEIKEKPKKLISLSIEWPESSKPKENISEYLKKKRAKRLKAFPNIFITDDQRVWCNYIKDDGEIVGWLKPEEKDEEWYINNIICPVGLEVTPIPLETICKSVGYPFRKKKMEKHPDILKFIT